MILSTDLTPEDWDVLRSLVTAVQSGCPIYYAVNESPEYADKVSIMRATITNPWVIVCGSDLVQQWKTRIPRIQRAQLANDGKTVVWGQVGI